MFKKLLATAVLICSIPALSAAWTLNTQITTAGGTITVGTTTQSVSSGLVTKIYPNATDTATIKVTPNPGYTLSSLAYTDNPAPAFTAAGILIPVEVGSSTGLDQTLTAQFLRNSGANQAYGVYASVVGGAAAGGSVTPAKIEGIYAGQATAAPITLRFIAQNGYKVTGITVDGNTIVGISPYVVNPAISAAKAGQSVNVTIPANTVFSANRVFVGTFAATGPVAGVSAPQTVTLSSGAVTLTGTGTGIKTAWTSVTLPGVAKTTDNPNGIYPAISANTATFSFIPAVVGTYQFKYTIDSDTSNPRASAVTTVFVVASYAAGVTNQCGTCHSSVGISPAILTNWVTSTHGVENVVCYKCHSGANTGGHPGVKQCSGCHLTTAFNTSPNDAAKCEVCHSNSDIHAVIASDRAANKVAGSCVVCHDVAFHASNVDANQGVRAIVGEFSKWSHHVTGVTLNDAHCAACHLEGKVSGSLIVVDTAVHMTDNKIHLRDTTAGTDADFAWDPATPNHSGMDTFCMSCHDANGAESSMSGQIQSLINANGLNAPGKTASASNPFGDTISNRYDKMQRPAVVDAKGQFTSTNNSHHAVSGPRYSGRTRTVAGTRAISNTNLRGAGVAVPGAFDNNSSATLYGARSTIYDAGNFNALYVPLANDGGETGTRTGAATLGDDSTLHCGDCHTVGQFKKNSTVNYAGTPVATVIGAHGSNNEYMLRNTLGSDVKHQGPNGLTATTMTYEPTTVPYLVCFNCHVFTKYGSLLPGGNGAAPKAHAGESDADPQRCNGPGNTIPFGGYTSGTATDGSQFFSRIDTKFPGKTDHFGNAFGIQCANCHNGGLENGYGGIHGSKANTYVDGMGMINKVERFLPGLGNSKYVPGTLGGFTGATLQNYSSKTAGRYTVTGTTSNDTNWEQKQSLPNLGTPGSTTRNAAAAYVGAGCYTLSPNTTAVTYNQTGPSVDGGTTATSEAFDTWGGCDDHGSQRGAADHGTLKQIVRPVTY